MMAEFGFAVTQQQQQGAPNTHVCGSSEQQEFSSLKSVSWAIWPFKLCICDE